MSQFDGTLHRHLAYEGHVHHNCRSVVDGLIAELDGVPFLLEQVQVLPGVWLHPGPTIQAQLLPDCLGKLPKGLQLPTLEDVEEHGSMQLPAQLCQLPVSVLADDLSLSGLADHFEVVYAVAVEYQRFLLVGYGEEQAKLSAEPQKEFELQPPVWDWRADCNCFQVEPIPDVFLLQEVHIPVQANQPIVNVLLRDDVDPRQAQHQLEQPS